MVEPLLMDMEETMEVEFYDQWRKRHERNKAKRLKARKLSYKMERKKNINNFRKVVSEFIGYDSGTKRLKIERMMRKENNE